MFWPKLRTWVDIANSGRQWTWLADDCRQRRLALTA
jgi:hypothetical protein